MESFSGVSSATLIKSVFFFNGVDNERGSCNGSSLPESGICNNGMWVCAGEAESELEVEIGLDRNE